MRRDSSSPEAYRADVGAEVEGSQRELLEAIRSVILEVAPDAHEGIQYGMLDYRGLANLAAQKDYVSLYVPSAVLAERKHEFPGVSTGKSCLRFRNVTQVDRKALGRLLKEVRAARRREASTV